MNAIVPINRTGALSRNDSQFARRLALFKATVGKDLVGKEIDESLEWCELYQANPFTKDIYFFVFDADVAAKRRVVPVLSIGLYRKVAARTGDYRPDNAPPLFRYDERLVGPSNPRGIIDVEMKVFRFAHGEWWPTVERVRWDERAPIIISGEGGFEWVDVLDGQGNPVLWTEGSRKGKPKRRKEPIGEPIEMLDPSKPNWTKMPETMLAKCCEAAAIRKGWPSETAGSYAEGELDSAKSIELTATEIIDGEERKERQTRIGGGNALPVDWMDGKPIEPVAPGAFFDRVTAFIKAHSKPGEEELSVIAAWSDKNRHALNQFWALEKDAALSLKKQLEAVAGGLKK